MTDNFDLLLNRKAGETTFFFPFALKSIGLDGKYYKIELIRRNKDDKKGEYHFKTYHIFSKESLRNNEDEIKKLCDMFGLRAYISTNAKDKEQITKEALAELASRVAKNDYASPWNVFDSCDSQFKENRKFVIDVDEEEYNEKNILKYAEIIDSCTNKDRLKYRCKFNMESPFKFVSYTGNEDDCVFDNVICALPTRNGFHIITYAFDINNFKKVCNEKFGKSPDVKPNGLTLLYENI